jgi:hypothetical protein
VRAGALERERLNLAAALGLPAALAAGGAPGPELPWELPGLMGLWGPVFGELTRWVADLVRWEVETPVRAALAATRPLLSECPVGTRSWARELHAACESALEDPSPMRSASVHALASEGRDADAWNAALPALALLDMSPEALRSYERDVLAREAVLCCGHAVARLFDPLAPRELPGAEDLPPEELFFASKPGDPVVLNGEAGTLVDVDYARPMLIVTTPDGRERWEVIPDGVRSYENLWARKRYADQQQGGGLDAVQAAALSVAFAACASGVDDTRARISAELVPWALER